MERTICESASQESWVGASETVHAEGLNGLGYVVSSYQSQVGLTTAQKRQRIARLLKANPERLNRQIAAEIGVDHKTVAAVRTANQAAGKIPQLEKTIGKDGKARAAR